jgi:hypothetical protein
MGKALLKIGNIRRVRGYRYRGKYGINEAVLVYGDKGTARFEGFLWGYGGEGPRGLVQLLTTIGVNRGYAHHVAFRTNRNSAIGTDWVLDFSRPALVESKPASVRVV